MTEPLDTSPLVLTVPAAAKALGISRAHCFDLIRDGELPSLKIGACRRISVRALEAYIAGLEAMPPVPVAPARARPAEEAEGERAAS